MSFEGRTTGGTRRRRMMMATPEPPQSHSRTTRPIRTENGDAAHLRRRYDERAKWQAQPTLTQLVPTRLLHQFVAASVHLAAVLGILALAAQALDGPLHRRDWPALVPHATASLASWWCALQCLGVAAVAILIYLVRRHRVDDYRGRYRWWLWAASFAFIASMDASTGLSNQVLGWAQSRLSQWSIDASLGAIAWPVIVAGLLAVPLVWEVAESRAARVAIGGLAVLAAVRLLVASGLMALGDPVLEMMVEAAMRLTIPLLLLTSLLLYARRINLLANGTIADAAAANESLASKRAQRGEAATSDDGKKKASGRKWKWGRLWSGKVPALKSHSSEEGQASEVAESEVTESSRNSKRAEKRRGNRKSRRASSESSRGANDSSRGEQGSGDEEALQQEDLAADRRRERKRLAEQSAKAQRSPETKDESRRLVDAGKTDLDEDEYSGLSKSERRRQRKLKRRQRRQQAA